MKRNFEDVKRLVPAFDAMSPMGPVLSFDGKLVVVDERCFDILVTARRQLETARAGLNTIATQDDLEMVLDPTWAKRIAEHALEAINKEGES